MKISKLDDNIPFMTDVDCIKCSYTYDIFPLDVGRNCVALSPLEVHAEEKVIDFIKQNDIKIFSQAFTNKEYFNDYKGNIEDYTCSRDIDGYEIILYWQKNDNFTTNMNNKNSNGYIIEFPSIQIMAKFKMLFT